MGKLIAGMLFINQRMLGGAIAPPAAGKEFVLKRRTTLDETPRT
jgi:hypothetical protein